MRLCSPDFFSTYMEYTRIQESPEPFNYAGAATCLSLALKGARYIEFEHYQVFPNLYTLLLAKTAECRKGGAVGIAYGLAQEAGLFNEDSMAEKISEAGLWMQGEDNVSIYGNSTIFIFADELSVALSKHEAYAGLIPFLTRFYESKRGTYTKRTLSGSTVSLVNPYVVTLLATTPTDFTALIPASASGTGFAPRLLTFYQDTSKGKITFPRAPVALREQLVGDLKSIAASCDPREPKRYTMTKECRDYYADWYEHKSKKPEDPELDGWFGRKHTNVLKLALLQAVAESDDLVLEKIHVKIGIDIVDHIETNLIRAYRLLGQIPAAANSARVLDQLARKGKWMSRSELQHINSNKMRAMELTEALVGLEVEEKVEKELVGNSIYYGLKGSKRE